MDPQLMKAWAMVESGGNKEKFLSDPFQVNNRGDWDPDKTKLGLRLGQVPGAQLSATAALQWLDKKGHIGIPQKDGRMYRKYYGLPLAFLRYNRSPTIDKNGFPHARN